MIYKEYIITFLNLETSIEKTDTFTAKTVGEAKSAFLECYRHAAYKILKVEEVY